MRWVITGASRGIGLELTKQLLERGDTVDAAVRAPDRATELRALGEKHGERLRVLACDVASDASVEAFAAALAAGPIDVLVNNAGVTGKSAAFEALDTADLASTFNVNALGPLRVTRALAGRLGMGSKAVSITSGMGSIGDNGGGGSYGYRMSKAALNMGYKSLSIDWKSKGVACAVVNPGWVKTDMGGAGAPLDVETSARNILRVVGALDLAATGSFLDHTGKTWVW